MDADASVEGFGDSLVGVAGAGDFAAVDAGAVDVKVNAGAADSYYTVPVMT